MGMALLRISEAAQLAAWAVDKKRFDEAKGFLPHASMDISTALAAGYITSDAAEAMRNLIEQHEEAREKDDKGKAQDTLTEISVKVYDITFQKVVECESGR